jgi:hypothetical protein
VLVDDEVEAVGQDQDDPLASGDAGVLEAGGDRERPLL